MKTVYVYGYGRGSTSDQELTIEGQKIQTCRVAEAIWGPRGHKLGGYFADRAVSGGILLSERPMGRKLCERLNRGDCVVVTKLDRAFRDAADTAAMIKLWTEQEIILHALDCGLDTSTPVGRCVAQIMGVIAEMERCRMSERIRESRVIMRRDGRAMGGRKPWGVMVRWIDKKPYWVTDWQERCLMGLIVHMRDDKGETWWGIVDYMNKEDLVVPSRRLTINKETREKGGRWQWSLNAVYTAYIREKALRKKEGISSSAGSDSSQRIVSSLSSATPSPSPDGEPQNSNS